MGEGKERTQVACSGREYGLSGSGVGWEEDLSGMNWDMSSDIESVDNSFLPLEKLPSLKSSYDTKKREKRELRIRLVTQLCLTL